MDIKSILGYSKGSPFSKNPYIDIDSNIIDMSSTPIDLWGLDMKTGKRKKMKAYSRNPYIFEGNVREYPMQQGGVTPQNMQDWNSFIDYLEKEGYKGNADLDIRDKNLSSSLLTQYNKLNPKSTLNYNMVPAFQQEFVNYRQKVIDDFRTGKAGISGLTKDNYSSVVGEDFSGFWPEISRVDNWLGSKTSKWKFPTLYIHTRNAQSNLAQVENRGLQRADTIKFQRGGFTARDLYKYLFEDDQEDYQNDYSESENTAPTDEEVLPMQSQQQEPDDYDVALQMAMQGDEFMTVGRNPYVQAAVATRAVGTNPYTPEKEANLSNPSKYAFEYFKGKGLPPHIAAGIVGNLMQESGNFRPDVITDEITGDNGTSHGIAQWHKDRWPAFLRWASSQGKNPKELDTQLEYVYVEATQRGDLGKVSTATTSSEAANLFAKYYERPAVIDKNRARNARQLHPD